MGGLILKLCSEECVPCCDFCVHAIHGHFFRIKDKKAIHVLAAPIGCTRFNDEEHCNLAKSCSYCDEFDCLKNYEEEI